MIKKAFLMSICLWLSCLSVNMKCVDHNPDEYKEYYPKLFIMDIDGSNEIPLLEGKKARFSPDGNKIVYEKNYHVMIMNADGTNEQDLGKGQNPSFSADGSKLVFNDTYNVYFMNIDGTNKQKISNLNEKYLSGSFLSPDGSKVIFAQHRWGNSYYQDIFIINSDGSNLEKIMEGDSPSFSPDGSKILFCRYNRIYTSNLDGSDEQVLGNGHYPSFSADGTKIIYLEQYSKIFIMNSDGSDKTNIASGFAPSFSADGMNIIFGEWIERN